MCIVLTLFYFALTALWQPDVLCPNLARYASYADSVCPAVVSDPEKSKNYGNVKECRRKKICFVSAIQRAVYFIRCSIF